MLFLSFFRGEKEFEAIDIFAENPLEFDQCDSRKQTFVVESIHVPVVCIPDLIEMKKRASREQDSEDIISLNRILGHDTKN